MVDQERLINSFCDLVRIDSPSGQEEDVSRHLEERLRSLGFQGGAGRLRQRHSV